MHHPLIDQKDLRKMPEEKVQELLSELRKKKNMVMRSSYNVMVLEQIESLIMVYQSELKKELQNALPKKKIKAVTWMI